MLNPQVIRQQIENLKLIHPELLEDEEAWLASLESETNVNELLTSIVRRIEDTKALVVGTKDRFEELKARKDRFEHRVDTLRGLAFKIMDAAGLQKAELPEATLSVRKGQPQLVGEPDVSKLPDDLCKIKREANLTAIKNVLLNGASVEGCTLSNGAPTISIRVK